MLTSIKFPVPTPATNNLVSAEAVYRALTNKFTQRGLKLFLQRRASYITYIGQRSTAHPADMLPPLPFFTYRQLQHALGMSNSELGHQYREYLFDIEAKHNAELQRRVQKAEYHLQFEYHTVANYLANHADIISNIHDFRIGLAYDARLHGINIKKQYNCNSYPLWFIKQYISR